MFVLRKVLKKEIIIYLDDILIANSTKEKHDEKMKRILKLLAENNLYKKKKKCKYFQT